MKSVFLDTLERFLVHMKADIEKDGMIATIDEAITRVRNENI